jgi:ubiquitin carboxyl-terminal hydrolase L5
VGYVPYNGQLYELDGLQAGPISFGQCTDENWLSLARDQIQARIQKYAQSEIRFNLLAIVQDKKEQALKELAQAESAGDQVLISELKLRIEQETEKQQRWKTENERRRHNYVPLIFELLQQLAKKNKLETLFKEAKEKKKQKEAEKKDVKMKAQ